MNNIPENVAYEPKRKNRFFVEFPKEFGIEPWHVRTVSRPKYNSTFGWSNIEITFVDPIAPSSSEALYKLIKFTEEMKKVIESDLPIFFFSIESLDPTGVKVEEWKIAVREIITIDFGDSDYNSDELQTPKLVVRPLFCQLNPTE